MNTLNQIQKNPAVIVIIIVAIVSITAIVISGGKPASIVTSGNGSAHATLGGTTTIPEPKQGF